MENVLSLEKHEYRSAGEKVLGVQQKLEHLQRRLKTMLNVIVLLVFELFLGIFHLFVSEKPENVDGQLCLITGGANGLGRHLAMRFAKEGCKIAICDIVDFDRTVTEIREKFNVQCQGFKCDVSNTESILRLKNDIEASMGNVDILVNNAGLLFMGPLLSNTLDNIQRCVDVNLISHFKVNYF